MLSFWKNFFSRFPPIFWSQYSYEYKKRFSHFFATIFFPTFFARSIGLYVEKLFRAFYRPILGHDIRVIIKNPFYATFFRRLFS